MHTAESKTIANTISKQEFSERCMCQLDSVVGQDGDERCNCVDDFFRVFLRIASTVAIVMGFRENGVALFQSPCPMCRRHFRLGVSGRMPESSAHRSRTPDVPFWIVCPASSCHKNRVHGTTAGARQEIYEEPRKPRNPLITQMTLPYRYQIHYCSALLAIPSTTLGWFITR